MRSCERIELLDDSTDGLSAGSAEYVHEGHFDRLGARRLLRLTRGTHPRRGEDRNDRDCDNSFHVLPSFSDFICRTFHPTAMRVSSGTRQKSVNPLVAAGKALTCDSRPLYRPDVRVQEIEPNPSGSFRRLWIPVEANSGEKGDLPDREDALHSFDEETFGSRRTRGVRNPRVRILHVNDAHHAHFGPFPSMTDRPHR